MSTAIGTICGYLQRAKAAGLTWELAQHMTDSEVEAALFRDGGRNQATRRAVIDYAHVHQELHKSTATLELLWSEYQEGVASRGEGLKPYQYSQFCELYGAWRVRLKPSMRRVHRAGEKAFLDYSGWKPKIFDRVTGDAHEVKLFVMVLGASNYTYAEATNTQRLPDFVGSTIRGFEHFNGVPEVIVPDQLRSAVKGPDRYEPDINATYLDMAQHYGVTVIPARPRKPKDKVKVEGAVLIVQRWILARLRRHKFFSLDELNQAIWELLDELNARPFQKLEGCRNSAFEKLDRPMLRALPPLRYEFADRRNDVSVNIDYHIEYDKRYYSVHHLRIHQRVEVRATVTTVEIFHDHERIATHHRSYGPPGTPVTDPAHRPENHRDQLWPPERLISWGAKFGPAVATVVELTIGPVAAATARKMGSHLITVAMASRHELSMVVPGCAPSRRTSGRPPATCSCRSRPRGTSTSHPEASDRRPSHVHRAGAEGLQHRQQGGTLRRSPKMTRGCSRKMVRPQMR